MRTALAGAAVLIALLLWWLFSEERIVRADGRHDPTEATRPAAEESEAVADPAPANRATNEDVEAAKGEPYCAVRLSLRDAATGDPTSSAVDLWRIGAPEDDEWTAGDHVFARNVSVRESGRVIEVWPPGRYRFTVHRQRVEDPAPSEFELHEGARADKVIYIALARKHSVRLRILDERGETIRRARVSNGWHRVRYGREDPTWAEPRRRKVALLSGGGGGGGGRGTGWLERRADARGLFNLGLFEEDSRTRQRTYSFNARPKGRTGIWVRANGSLRADAAYVGVSVRWAEIQPLVVYPDAATLKEARAEINAWSYAVQDDGTLAPGFWRRLPIEVTVTREGYRTVKLTYRIDEPPAPVIAELASEAK